MSTAADPTDTARVISTILETVSNHDWLWMDDEEGPGGTRKGFMNATMDASKGVASFASSMRGGHSSASEIVFGAIRVLDTVILLTSLSTEEGTGALPPEINPIGFGVKGPSPKALACALIHNYHLTLKHIARQEAKI